MEIKIGNDKFFVPDVIGTDKTKSIQDVYDNAIPLNIHNTQQLIIEIQNDIISWEEQPDEITTPNVEKINNINILNKQKEDAELKLYNLIKKSN